MISVGSRDGRKGLSLRYGVEGDMDLETELEEGEACFQNNNDDDSTIDPDVALSYIDEKLQDVLGHFQKDFEGGFSAENLGAKFGGYGSFLPTYQRSPAGPHSKTPPKVHVNNTSPNDPHMEGGRQNSSSISNPSQTIRHVPTLTSSAPPPRGVPINGKVKQEVHMSSARGADKFTSNGQQPINHNFDNICDQKSLKVRIKVGSDNLSTRKNAEIYSGLGLDVSPSSSVEASPLNSDDLCHVPNDTPGEESPTSILEMMTSFPVLGGLLLSPLPYDLLYLSAKEKREDSSCGSVHKRSQESTFSVNKSDSKFYQNEKKPKAEVNFVSVESINDVGSVKKEASLDFRKSDIYKGEPSVMPKEESSDPVLIRDDFRVEKPNKKDNLDGNANSDEKLVTFLTKSDPDVSKSGKILDTGLVEPLNQKLAQKATSYEKDGMKVVTSSSGSKKKSKGSHGLENGLKNNNSSSKNKTNNYGSKLENPKINNEKVKETYKDFFGELDPELEDCGDLALEDKLFGDNLKDCRVMEKGSLDSNISSKERLNRNNELKPSLLVYPEVGPTSMALPTMGNGGPVSDTAAPTVAAVVNEDWVCCDKCEKWRLLPHGVNPGTLPEKWLCSMLDWLPGMNRCSISQEETTKAMTTHFPGPTPTVHGTQPVQHCGSHPGTMSGDPLHPDQRHQPFSPMSGVKAKHGIKDVSNELKLERPSMSSNSTKRSLQTSNKTRSLNGANQSPIVNEIEFQDSGHSSSLIAEKQRLKHKEKKKICENLADEGNNARQLKLRNKRESSEDYSRDSKKMKMKDNKWTHKDRASGNGGAVSKTVNDSINDLPSRKDHQEYDDHSKDSKSIPKIFSTNSKHPNGTLHERDIVKKRKSNEFDDNTQIEESSESRQRKGKKVKIPESQEEEKRRSLAATSSSSKVSSSHKIKTNHHEAKGSPVESVSSSPLRIVNPDKFTSSRRNIESVEYSQDPKKHWEDDRGNYQSNIFRKELDVAESLHMGAVPSLEFDSLGAKPSIQGERRNDEQAHSNGYRARKNEKGFSSRSKEKNRSSKSDVEKINLKTSERMTEKSDVEKSKGGRNRSLDKVDDKSSANPSKFEQVTDLKKESSGKPAMFHDGKQNNMLVERDGEKFSKRDVAGKGKPHSLPLPPSGKIQSESTRPPQPVVASQKENVGNKLVNDGVEGSDALKSVKQKKKDENQNGNQSMNTRHPTPNVHKGTPSPLRRESSSQAASAIKEAKALKHMADRLKNSGDNHESNSLYFQAVLKFLYGSSLLESSYNESGKHSDMIQSTSMYGSTAKLCEYVAHEYEKLKEMAAAALAYKLAEVAYLKVVYSSHTSASKDRQELQTSLQIGPTGESPSSSASDIDNLNNPAAADKNALARGVNDPQIGGNHVIAARIKPNFLRILNFAQDVNFAMEASRRSQIAFAACGSQSEHSHHKEVIKSALDFNFQDVEGLLQLVRVAMEVIST
ncbi:hypothetical protein R6Q57_028150 [Mikania cordata]